MEAVADRRIRKRGAGRVRGDARAAGGLSWRRKAAYACVVGVVAYVVAELAATGLYLAGVLPNTRSEFFAECDGRAFRFDPVLGYRYERGPWRRARITRDGAEWCAATVGNGAGFLDGEFFVEDEGQDAEAKRDEGLRIGVLGDSFTDAPYLERNWPTVAEGMAAEAELLNFAQAGTGLANWWSIVTRHWAEVDYGFDAVVIAVYPPDLKRKFSMSDDDGESIVFGRVGSWDPATYPTTVDEARRWMGQRLYRRVDADAFEVAVAEGVRPGRLYLASQVWWRAEAHWRKYWREREARASDGAARDALIAEMAAALGRMEVPVVVVHVPERDAVVAAARGGAWEVAEPPADTVRFAEMLDARLVDGSEAFRDLDAESARGQWFHYDAHWNQAGSDRFAAWMAEVITRDLGGG